MPASFVEELARPGRGDVIPELLEEFHIGGGYALGVLSLGALVSFQLDLWPLPGAADEPRWSALWVITVAALLIGLAYFMAGGMWLAARWKRRVPPAERRQAVLARRSIDDLIPRSWRIATYAVVVLHAAAWVAVGVLGLKSTSEFWNVFVQVAILSATFTSVFSFIAYACVNRPPHALDRIFGSGYRRGEVRMSFPPQLLPPVVGSVTLYQELTGSTTISFTRGMYLGLTLLTMLACLRALSYRNMNQRSNGAQPRGKVA